MFARIYSAIGADFHRAMVATAAGEKLVINYWSHVFMIAALCRLVYGVVSKSLILINKTYLYVVNLHSKHWWRFHCSSHCPCPRASSHCPCPRTSSPWQQHCNIYWIICISFAYHHTVMSLSVCPSVRGKNRLRNENGKGTIRVEVVVEVGFGIDI